MIERNSQFKDNSKHNKRVGFKKEGRVKNKAKEL